MTRHRRFSAAASVAAALACIGAVDASGAAAATCATAGCVARMPDVVVPTERTVSTSSGMARDCKTPDQVGIAGRYGARGYFISGCKVTLLCPTWVTLGCGANSYAHIRTTNLEAIHRVSLNSRLREIDANGNVLDARDKSCGSYRDCHVYQSTYIRPGQSASTECNGVREYGRNTASIECGIRLSYS